MNRKTAVPDLGTPTEQYDFQYMLSLTRQIEAFKQQVIQPGDAVEGTLTLLACPVSGYGLRRGAVWMDGNGFLKIVRTTDVFAPSLAIDPRIGKAVAA